MSSFDKIILNIKRLGFSLTTKIITTLIVSTALIGYLIWDMGSYIAAGTEPGLCVALGVLTCFVLFCPVWLPFLISKNIDLRKLKSSEATAYVFLLAVTVFALTAFYTRVFREVQDQGLVESLKAFAFAILLVAGLACFWIVRERHRRWRAPIVAGLPRSLPEARDEFRQRILRAFPPGTEERSIVEALRAQGFRRPSELGRLWQPAASRHLDANVLVLNFRGMMSRQSWGVMWVADADRRIVSALTYFRSI